jgi:hypothetical protein
VREQSSIKRSPDILQILSSILGYDKLCKGMLFRHGPMLKKLSARESAAKAGKTAEKAKK